MYGPGFKPKVAGRKKRRKRWAQKNPKLNSQVLNPGESLGSAPSIVLPRVCWVVSGKVRDCRWLDFCLAASISRSLCFGEPLNRYVFRLFSSTRVVFWARTYRCAIGGRLGSDWGDWVASGKARGCRRFASIPWRSYLGKLLSSIGAGF